MGLKVANVPEYSPYAIAEHAVALILALNRKIIIADKQVHQQNFTTGNLVGFDLHGKTVGRMKIEMMRKNPQVCFEVDEMKSFTNWKSVIAWG